ncbi:hypothetical protein [Pseudoxanthomonas sp. SE1]|uniref:hypothetical protein n=1 Tax=Pseudoxanthomonas sp. SE1 TaxID=1664560 RepID=UPI00240E0F4D|nr:hypothetical protein [Pseudoxanthomonas sp. SE1]WFC41715.1 hypothetical protein OY559_18405 [Pseudoxanthomonas sp. SE1]
MALTEIIKAPPSANRCFHTTTKNTAISQRKTLEEAIVNLATALGSRVIYKQLSSRGTYFYEVQGVGLSGFQSASNTILELSRMLASSSKV